MNTELRTYFATNLDADRYQRTQFVCSGLIYGHFVICMAGVLPFWTLLLSIPPLVVRWMIALHELFHVRGPRDVDFLTRIQPLFFTPLALGFREYRAIHFGHHRHMATSLDPDFFHIRGSKLQGFLNALSAPEQSFFRWVNVHGLNSTLLRDAALRTSLAVLLIMGSGWNFLWYFVPLRLAYGLSYFSFFYCLHRRGAQYGVYAVSFSARWARLFRVLLGADAYAATCHHPLHHSNPAVAASHLPEVEALRIANISTRL